MPTIHELLDDTQKRCQALADEMLAFKSARVLNQKAAEGLDATCAALKATIRAIEPLTELRVLRMTRFLIAATCLNVILFVMTLLVVLPLK